MKLPPSRVVSPDWPRSLFVCTMAAQTAAAEKTPKNSANGTFDDRVLCNGTHIVREVVFCGFLQQPCVFIRDFSAGLYGDAREIGV